MSPRRARILAWTPVGAIMVLAFTGLGLEVAVGSASGFDELLPIAIFLVSAAVGGLVASRLPANPIGWILVGLVVALGLSGAFDGLIALALDRGRLGGPVPWMALYSSAVFLAFFATLLYTLLLFPNGKLPTRRSRVVFWAGTAGLLLTTGSVVTQPGELEDHPRFTNPIGVDNVVLDFLILPGVFLFLAGVVGAAAALVVRFRRARGVERQQLTLVVAAGVLAVVGFVVSWPVRVASETVSEAIVLTGLLAIPLAIGAAMLRYRLYEIDRVISRTLVYASLTVILGATYAALVLAGQAVFSSFAGGSDLAIAGSTLVVAAFFLPLRSRVQRFVDRRFYRRRYDAQRTLEAFGARLREEVDLEALSTDLGTVVRETMQPAHVSVWLRGEAR